MNLKEALLIVFGLAQQGSDENDQDQQLALYIVNNYISTIGERNVR